MEITITQAQHVLNQAIGQATKMKVDANIVVLDNAGFLKSFVRMDQAYLGSIDIAFGKAKTAMLFRMNSEEVGAFLDPAQKAYGMINTSGGLVGFKGGMPVKSQDIIIGYIGVSGGSPDQDFEIASAGSLI